jgi:hypothetical protein
MVLMAPMTQGLPCQRTMIFQRASRSVIFGRFESLRALHERSAKDDKFLSRPIQKQNDAFVTI